jgi:ketosteroid isomerase-like protein
MLSTGAETGGAVTPSELVHQLYRSYQARDWDQAAALLHPDATVDMPATSEHLAGRDTVVAWSRDFPEPWGTLTVGRVYGDDEGAVAEVTVVDPHQQEYRMAGFWTVRDGLLHQGLELWVDVGGEPPPGRATEPATRQARQAGQSRFTRPVSPTPSATTPEHTDEETP